MFFMNRDDTTQGLKRTVGNTSLDTSIRIDVQLTVISILGHESEGAVTPAGLRAWARRERATARGGSGQGILGWHRKAISAYTWCVTEKGPQNKWLHYVKKADTPACRCQQENPEQSGEHLVERCSLLTKARGQVGGKKLLEWKSRHARNKAEKEEGPVGPAAKEKEKETDEMENFFCQIYEFHIPTPTPAVFIPAALPPRYAISFVPALPVSPALAPVSPTSVPASPVSPVIAPPATPVTDGFSVVSSANFVPASVFTSSFCIGTTQ